jgi:TonB family protein
MEMQLNEQSNSFSRIKNHEAGVLAVSTLVLWLMCATVGLIGLFWPRDQPALVIEPAPIDAELLLVEATNQRSMAELNPSSAQPAADVSAPPRLPAVAAPNPAIAFAEPMSAPVRVMNAPRIATTRPAVIQLTFGEGEGQQPAPEYPPESVIAGQEGTVLVRLTVGENGRVTDAIASGPCNWPLLNNAAVRAVRTTWHFSRGPVRSYGVSIQFHLNRHE